MFGAKRPRHKATGSSAHDPKLSFAAINWDVAEGWQAAIRQEAVRECYAAAPGRAAISVVPALERPMLIRNWHFERASAYVCIDLDSAVPNPPPDTNRADQHQPDELY